MKNRFSLQLSSSNVSSGFTSSPNLLASPPKLKSSVTSSPIMSPPLSTMSYDQESDIFEDITLTFTLPDGSVFSLKFKSGDTVQEVKRKLDTTKGIAARSSSLFWNGKYMMDPLSLNDFPGLVSKSEVQIEVKISQNTQNAPVPQHHLQQHHPQQYHQHFEGLKKQYIEDMQGKSYSRCKSAVFATETKEPSPVSSSPSGDFGLSSSPYRATIQPLPLGGLSFLTESESAELHTSPKLSLSASTNTSVLVDSVRRVNPTTISNDSSCSSISTYSSGVSSASVSPLALSLGKKSGSKISKLDLSASNNTTTATSPSSSPSSSPSLKTTTTQKTEVPSINITSTTNNSTNPASPKDSTRSLDSESKEEKKERKKREKIEKRMSRRLTKLELKGLSTSPRKIKPLEDISPSKRSCIVM
eukprot:TRINITY_DN1865_c1_g1_i1.p1 TRINITY_DN1865_c1_g1~~TRINITY_DN1865_c1_g1_i1.p1  ORF type:complete len:415 (-),score=108.54 TRINITY_DN1865_c1_g1_i1:32-1276(-)